MNDIFPSLIAGELGLRTGQVQNTLRLIDDGATVPFISRYRKEATGNLDEVAIGNIAQAYAKLKETQARKETIVAQIEQQGKLTAELRDGMAMCGVHSLDEITREIVFRP